jgi:hypothetical protein
VAYDARVPRLSTKRLRLAALGALLGTLLLTGASPAGSIAAPTTVAVDLGGIDAATFREIDGLDLEQRVLVRLVEDGFATVARKAGPALTIVIRSVGTDIVIEETTIGLRAAVAGAGLSTDELHLAVAQQAAELARRAMQELVLRTGSAAPSLVVFAGTAALYRPSAVDLRSELGAGVRVRRWFPHVIVGFIPASVPGLHIYEIEAQLGLAWQTGWSRRWTVQIASRLGARAHHFDGDQARLLERSGTRLDAVTTLGAMARWRASAGISLGVELVAGLTSAAYEHDINGVAVWRRGVERAQAGVTVEWRP